MRFFGRPIVDAKRASHHLAPARVLAVAVGIKLKTMNADKAASNRFPRRRPSKVKRQLVTQRLAVDDRGPHGFAEKLVQIANVRQLEGSQPYEGTVAGAATRARPCGNTAVRILQCFCRPR